MDFDIIDLTFTKDGVETVIPVIMSPMDIAADGTPPLDTTKDGLAWWQIILGLILFLVIFFLLLKFAPAVVYAVGKVIALPFKGIGKLFKAIGSSVKRRRERKAISADDTELQEGIKGKRKRKRKDKDEEPIEEEYFNFDDMDFDDEFWKMLDGLDY